MLDTRVGDDDEFDETRLPWLEPIEEDDLRGPSLLSIVSPILIGLVIFALLIGGAYWMWTRSAAPAGPPPVAAAKDDDRVNVAEPPAQPAPAAEVDKLIPPPSAPRALVPAPQPAVPAPPAPIEVAPPPIEAAPPPPQAAPRQASAPRKVHKAAIRHHRSTRVVHTPAPRRSYAAVIRKQVPARKEAYRPVTALAKGVTSIQLGAYDNLAQARWVWKSLSGRFGYLKPLVPSITTVRVHGRKFYRLRAAGLHADTLCKWLKAAHETCFVVS
jgi:hypothetical protein